MNSVYLSERARHEECVCERERERESEVRHEQCVCVGGGRLRAHLPNARLNSSLKPILTLVLVI